MKLAGFKSSLAAESLVERIGNRFGTPSPRPTSGARVSGST